MTRRTVTLLALCLVALACRPVDVRNAGPDTITISSGVNGGIYDAYGDAVASALHERLGTEVTVLETGGSLDNLRQVARGTSDLGFSAVDAAADAVRGRGEFRRPMQLRALARIYDDVVHLVVPEDSPIRRVDDLRGARTSLGAPGSGTSLIARRLLHAAGVPEARVRARSLSLTESIDAMKAGRLDAFFWSGGLPTPALGVLADAMPLRLVPLSHLGESLRASHGDVYRHTIIPGGTYGVDAQVETLAVPNVLVVPASMPPDTARDLLETVMESRGLIGSRVPSSSRLDDTKAIFTNPVALHRGVLAFYRETKE